MAIYKLNDGNYVTAEHPHDCLPSTREFSICLKCNLPLNGDGSELNPYRHADKNFRPVKVQN